ncbi:MAG: hypothetical protein R3F43_11605 [bacterium]
MVDALQRDGDIEDACGGDPVALFGVECAFGRHLHRRQRRPAMTSMRILEPSSS